MTAILFSDSEHRTLIADDLAKFGGLAVRTATSEPGGTTRATGEPFDVAIIDLLNWRGEPLTLGHEVESLVPSCRVVILSPYPGTWLREFDEGWLELIHPLTGERVQDMLEALVAR